MRPEGKARCPLCERVVDYDTHAFGGPRMKRARLVIHTFPMTTSSGRAVEARCHGSHTPVVATEAEAAATPVRVQRAVVVDS